MRIEDIFQDLPVLQTERLRLRKLSMHDVEDVFAYASSPEVARYVVWTAHETIEDSRTFVASVLEQYDNGVISPWGIENRDNGRLIGTCGFASWNISHARAEIGYALGREYWGRGYMTEAARHALAFGFEHMGLNRIQARCEVDNVGSARVMEKIGMSYEGTLRQQMFVKGTYRDMKMYSVLRRDWR